MCNEVWPSGWTKSLQPGYRAHRSQVAPFLLTTEDVGPPQVSWTKDQTKFSIDISYIR